MKKTPSYEELAQMHTALLEKRKAERIAIRELIGNIGHEIRTPLNGMLGYSNIIKDQLGPLLTQKHTGYLNHIIDAGNRLMDRVSDLFEYYDATSEELVPYFQHLLRQDLKKEWMAKYLPRASAKGLLFDIRIDPEIPSHLKLDGGKVSRILGQLLGNSLKFTQKGSVILEIQLPQNPLLLLFKVIDTGKGLSVDERDHLFQHDVTAVSSYNKESDGCGLGAAVAMTLVRLLGGEIWVEHTSEKGTCVCFTTPFQAVTQEEEKDAALATLDTVSDSGALNILLAEDDEMNQKTVYYFLRKLNHIVALAKNGREVLELLEARSFDVILMDIKMPVMTGVETTMHIRRSSNAYKDIPIIAMTAYARIEDSQMFKKVGMDDHVIKPLDFKIVMDKIQKVLNRKEREGI
ncbi:response regulator [Desulfobacter latus]|nr:response regulator [Desulfobacter latus]